MPNPFDRQVNITDQQITAYCDCYAVQIVMSVTAEEMGYVVRNHQFSENFKRKIEESGAACSRSVLLLKPLLGKMPAWRYTSL
jgi:hypothetical protein